MNIVCNLFILYFQYMVVKFEDGAVSVIPTNWLKSEQECLWPTTGRNLRTMIIKRSDPKDDWTTHKILEIYDKFGK